MSTLVISPTETHLFITGMSCGHCVAAITQEVSALPGVQDVQVNLETGDALVRGSRLDPTAIKAAVEEAGYTAAVK